MDLKNGQILVGELLDDPRARAVLKKRLGRLLNHPMVPAARSLTLEQAAGLARAAAPGKIVEETLEELRRV